MVYNYVWEHKGSDTILYCADLPGAFTRGRSLEEALGKMPQELQRYCRWAEIPLPEPVRGAVSFEKVSDLNIQDADSDVLFPSEREVLTFDEYRRLKALCLKSARDFLALYDALPDKKRPLSPARVTFYGQVPSTAEEMYRHTQSVNAYYFAEIDVDADNEGTILSCREQGFAALERKPDFLNAGVMEGSYGEQWSLRKVLRRFLWHDRIHARAMYRRGTAIFGADMVPDIFFFAE